eukprot:COSAG02_NODE_2784_length_8036_cov_15.324808_2_plen_332_part_00
MARLLLRLIAAAALSNLGESVRSRKGAAASTEVAPPPSPAGAQNIGGTTKAGKSEDYRTTVEGSPLDYDLVYAIDDDNMEDLMNAIDGGALVNGCESTMTAYAAGLYRQITTEYYVPQRMHERVPDSMRVAENGLTPLHYMLLRSCPLLKAADQPSRPVWPGPPNLDMMRVLLEHGASPNVQTHRSGRTPLMLAAAFGFTEAVELMLEFGAKINLRSTWGDKDAAAWAEMPTHKGLLGGHYELARHLRDPETGKAARSRQIVLRADNTVATENGCLCKLLWEDDDGQTQVSCPPSERWCEVEPGCDAAKDQTDEYDGWDECSAERTVKDVL